MKIPMMINLRGPASKLPRKLVPYTKRRANDKFCIMIPNLYKTEDGYFHNGFHITSGDGAMYALAQQAVTLGNYYNSYSPSLFIELQLTLHTRVLFDLTKDMDLPDDQHGYKVNAAWPAIEDVEIYNDHDGIFYRLLYGHIIYTAINRKVKHQPFVVRKDYFFAIYSMDTKLGINLLYQFEDAPAMIWRVKK